MDLFKNNFLRIPLLIFALVFLVDKVAFIPFVKNSIMFWKKIEPLLYESRNNLFIQLEKDYAVQTKNNKRLGLILGTSRSSEFDTAEIAKYIPDSYTYNFSAPFTSVAYYYYWYDRIAAASIKPDFVILEIDAAVMSAQAIEYQLSYSFDPWFVLQHTDLNRPRMRDPWNQTGKGFSVMEADKYFLKQLFGFYKYPFKPGNIADNHKKQFMPMPDGSLKEIRLGNWRQYALPIIKQVNQEKLGGIPNFFFSKLPDDQMKEDIVRSANRDYLGYRSAPTQVVFVKKLLERLARDKVQVWVYIPFVNPDLYAYIHNTRVDGKAVYDVKETFHDPLLKLIDKINHQYGARIRVVNPNVNQTMRCQKFSDAYHLAGECFAELTRTILQ